MYCTRFHRLDLQRFILKAPRSFVRQCSLYISAGNFPILKGLHHPHGSARAPSRRIRRLAETEIFHVKYFVAKATSGIFLERCGPSPRPYPLHCLAVHSLLATSAYYVADRGQSPSTLPSTSRAYVAGGGRHFGEGKKASWARYHPPRRRPRGFRLQDF